MLTQGTGFARYSKSLCWIVALIWMVLSFLAFTGGSGSSIINDFLWLAGAIALQFPLALFRSLRVRLNPIRMTIKVTLWSSL